MIHSGSIESALDRGDDSASLTSDRGICPVRDLPSKAGNGEDEDDSDISVTTFPPELHGTEVFSADI